MRSSPARASWSSRLRNSLKMHVIGVVHCFCIAHYGLSPRTAHRFCADKRRRQYPMNVIKFRYPFASERVIHIRSRYQQYRFVRLSGWTWPCVSASSVRTKKIPSRDSVPSGDVKHNSVLSHIPKTIRKSLISDLTYMETMEVHDKTVSDLPETKKGPEISWKCLCMKRQVRVWEQFIASVKVSY